MTDKSLSGLTDVGVLAEGDYLYVVRSSNSRRVTVGNLASIDSLAVTDGNIIVGDGTNWVAESGATARTSLGLGTSDSPTFTGLTVSGTASVGTNLVPDASDGAGLGTSLLPFSDLFLASGAVINFNSGDVAITHSANQLNFSGASIGYYFDATVGPQSNDAGPLGTAALSWSDLFLASGGVINFNAGNVTVTHAAALLTIAGGGLVLAAGTTALGPLKFQSGTNLTTVAAGTEEFDGVQRYFTIDTTGGRGAVPVEQYFHLTADGSAISTIANFFGANSNISLVASAHYIIDIYLWFLNTTGGTVTWTLTNSAAPTAQNIIYEESPVTGLVAPPGTATLLVGHTLEDATAALAITTGTLTTAVNHYVHIKIFLANGTGTSLKIQATKNVGGTITPQSGSYWMARRVSPNNIGTFAA